MKTLGKLYLELKNEMHDPVTFNFPIIGRFQFKRRERARGLASEIKNQLLVAAMNAAHRTNQSPDTRCLADDLITAWQTAKISEKQLQDNLNILFFASEENPQAATLSAMYLLAKHPVRLPLTLITPTTYKVGTSLTFSPRSTESAREPIHGDCYEMPGYYESSIAANNALSSGNYIRNFAPASSDISAYKSSSSSFRGTQR